MSTNPSPPNPVLFTSSDGRPGQRTLLSVEVKAPGLPAIEARAESTQALREEEPAAARTEPAVLEFKVSSATLDRFGEIIEPAGWRLDHYRRNPVFQNAHQYGDIRFTLGKALSTEVRDGALVQRIQFAVDANPAARIAYELYKGGFLNAVSVGFVPLRWTEGSPELGFRRRYLEQELLEVSAVAIPANPDALRLALAEARDTESPGQWSPLSETTPCPPICSDWLQLARFLHDLLKR